jgi:hypothetical protein
MPSLQSITPFIINTTVECLGILYQVWRMTPWWFNNVELRHLNKVRHYLVGDGFIEDAFWLCIRARRSKVTRLHQDPEEDIEEPSIDKYRTHVMVNMYYTTLGKTFSAISFLIFISFMHSGWNKQFYPIASEMSDSDFNRVITFGIIAVCVYVGLGGLCFLFTSIWLKTNSLAPGIQYVKNSWKLFIACSLGALMFPVALTGTYLVGLSSLTFHSET